MFFGTGAPTVYLIDGLGVVTNTIVLPQPNERTANPFIINVDSYENINDILVIKKKQFKYKESLIYVDPLNDDYENIVDIMNWDKVIKIAPWSNEIQFDVKVTDTFPGNSFETMLSLDYVEIEFTAVNWINKIPNLDLLYTSSRNITII